MVSWGRRHLNLQRTTVQARYFSLARIGLDMQVQQQPASVIL